MESLESLRGQLESFDKLHTLVKTMKAMSAASIRQYEKAVISLTDYTRTVELGLHVVLQDMQEPVTAPRPKHELPRLAAIVFGSDHGLCGRFNEEITTCVLEYIASTATHSENRLLLAVGARVTASLEQAGESTQGQLLAPAAASQITATVQKILLKVDEWREQFNVHNVSLFCNRHLSRDRYLSTRIELLPVNLRHFHRLEKRPWPSHNLPIFSMEREQLMARLLRQYFFVSIFRACAESLTSEHASRLLAMQSAERNLDNRIEELTLTFRRARQNAITSELLDVVSGFETITSSS
jgi:F-type H+-transporting ATPase subunit gamma